MQKSATLLNIFIVASIFATPPYACARTVSEIQIDEVGMSKYPDQESIKQCKNFTPTLRQVTSYFNKAYPVEADFATLERNTPCFASGSLRFNDGFSGSWVLYSSGTASFTFQRGDYVTFYAKYHQWDDPTACTYGSEEQKKC